MKCLVMDVGGSYIKYALEQNEKLEQYDTCRTPNKNLTQFKRVIDQICDKYKEFDAIGISIPGRVDVEKGKILTKGALGYIEGLELKKELEEKYKKTVWIENDAKCAALAEVTSGYLKGCRNALVYIIGTGIGGGVVLDGKLYRGSAGFAGEFSYVNTKHDYNDVEGRYKLSEICSVPGFIKMMERVFGKRSNYSAKDYFDLILKGDTKAERILDEYAKKIAISLYNLQCVFDVEKIAIGGGISEQDILIQYISRNMAQLYHRQEEDLPRPEVSACHYKNHANLMGASYLVHARGRKEE